MPGQHHDAQLWPHKTKMAQLMLMMLASGPLLGKPISAQLMLMMLAVFSQHARQTMTSI